MKKLIGVIGIIAIVAVVGIIVFNKFGDNNNNTESIVNGEAELVDVTVLQQTLEQTSELSTGKLKLLCSAHYDDDGVKIFNRSDFTMEYEATVRAGIDVSDVEIPEDLIDNENKIIYVKVPCARIFDDVYIDHDSIKYYDSEFSFFNSDAKEDSTKALAFAEEKAIITAEDSGLIDIANTQVKSVIYGLLAPLASQSGYTIEIIDK